MLYTRNAFYFRDFFRENVGADKDTIDLNFIGSTPPNGYKGGFARLIYGYRKDIGKLLGTIALNVAADDQAIYELIQNADDSNSSIFSVSFNEDYLLCINNGDYFSNKDMSAIINVAGNDKGGEDIGSFGIGFKILHRLVGADDGREAIINDYAGPIIFSWNKFSQLEAFLGDEDISVGDDKEKDSENPWLVKLVYTCFPTHLDEKIKLQDYYTDDVKFTREEMAEMREFLKQSLSQVDSEGLKNLNSGSIFFLKLGKGKIKFLEEGINKIKGGLAYSFKFLNNLRKIYINGEEIQAKEIKEYNAVFPIGSKEFYDVSPKNRNRDIKFTFAFHPDHERAVELRGELVPNLYTYFSMDEEKNGFSFILHCNAFDMNNDRRKLQANSQINDRLLPLITKNIIEYIDRQKEINRNLFLEIYTNLLLSKEPINKPHINEHFYGYFKNYIKENIPTKHNGYSNNSENVKIKSLKLELNLSEFGLDDIQWFAWDSQSDKILLDEAIKPEKLGIERWYITNVIEQSKLDKINSWIEGSNAELYQSFLQELEGASLTVSNQRHIRKIKFFKFSDGKFYSFDDVIGNYSNGKGFFKFSNYLFCSSKTRGIRSELIKLGLVMSEVNIEDYKNIFTYCPQPEESAHYHMIAKLCYQNGNQLSAEEKKKIFLNLTDESTKFSNVGDETFKRLELFSDNQGNIKQLSKLVNVSENALSWIKPYEIKRDEYFPKLNDFLTHKDKVFDEIVEPNIEFIKDNLTEVKEIKELVQMFTDNHRSFFKEYIIKTSESGFLIIKRTSGIYQIIPPTENRTLYLNFIEDNLSESFIVLPLDFSEFNSKNDILKDEGMYTIILELIDVDEHKDILVDIMHYSAPIRKFLVDISELRFNSSKEFVKEDYEFKILDKACNFLRKEDFLKFKEKMIFEVEERSFNHSEIAFSIDMVKIGDKEFSLSKILPTTYKNSNLVSDLIAAFTQLGISNEKLNNLFGIHDALDVKEVYEKYSSQPGGLENSEQFLFLIFYHQKVENVDLSELNFNLNQAVYPSDFGLESEKLPGYIHEWIEQDELSISDLKDVGIYTESSSLIDLRRYFLSNEDVDIKSLMNGIHRSDGEMLFNTLKLLKREGIELKNEDEYDLFKEIVRKVGRDENAKIELHEEEGFDFDLLKEKSTNGKTYGIFTVYEYDGKMPKLVFLDKFGDYIFYRYSGGDYAVQANEIYLNEKENRDSVLRKIALDDNNSFTSNNSKDIRISDLEAEVDKYKNLERAKEDNLNPDFLQEVDNFISELEGSGEWNDFIPQLKNILELSLSQPLEKQKLFNLIAKIKLAKELNIRFEFANENYNHLVNGNEKYFVHSARGTFAYIHPTEILKMNNEGYKMALDFTAKSNIKIYETAEEILQLNTNHLLVYQDQKTLEELFAFCDANRQEKKHLLIIDPNNSVEKSRDLLKLLNNEDDYR